MRKVDTEALIKRIAELEQELEQLQREYESYRATVTAIAKFPEQMLAGPDKST